MRSLGLMVVMTVLIIALGVLVAVLMTRLGRGWRVLVSVGLLLAWAMPPLAATVVWGWIFDTQYGVRQLGAEHHHRARTTGRITPG